MVKGYRIGVALENYTSDLVDCKSSLDFLEYGYHAKVGIPDWLNSYIEKRGLDVNLHPLDVNMSEGESIDNMWINKLSADVATVDARALVTDGFYWYHGQRTSTWARPAHFKYNAQNCASVAREIQSVCRRPFRVENPPVEWMPETPSIWDYLDEIIEFADVDLCLDLSHLIQFEHNIHGQAAKLPRLFNWQRVKEVHLSGYIAVSFQGQRYLIDQHDAVPCHLQYKLLEDLMTLLPQTTVLDICLEMEPHHPAVVDHTVQQIRGLLG